MSLSTGARLGSYEILSLLGSGGMGEVYRARDTRLGRDVAIKVLPDLLASDPDRLARFQREAQVLASLNHPNIAAIYGLEESGGIRALILELVEGQTLAERLTHVGRALSGPPGSPDLIRSGPHAIGSAARATGPHALASAPHATGSGLPLDEALPIVRQIADALEAAHEKGIVHRDLKPANIKVTPEGVVKVLDFGLAKAMAGDAASAEQTNLPTLTAAPTRMGVILGTAAYMSPEQARGKGVDKRGDIWAFGCVLYEMLTGKRTFDGTEISDTLAFVITKEPDWSVLPEATPASIRKLLRRCLEKDRKRRLADIADARFEIDEALTPDLRRSGPELRDAGRTPGDAGRTPGDVGRTPGDVGRTLSGPPQLRTSPRLPWAVAAASVLAAVALLVLWAPWRTAPPPMPLRLEAGLGADAVLVTTGGVGAALAAAATGGTAGGAGAGAAAILSPDGSTLAFIAQSSPSAAPQLYVRRLDQLQAATLAGTDGAYSPFFSPDGQ